MVIKHSWLINIFRKKRGVGGGGYNYEYMLAQSMHSLNIAHVLFEIYRSV